MNTFIHADIFFFVATICMAVLTIFVMIIGISIIKILLNFRNISETAKLECALILKEIGSVRERIHEQGLLRHIFHAIF